MPITNLLWAPNQGYDIHVLRNNQTSQRLDDKIFVVEEIAANQKLEFKSGRDINSHNVPPPPEYQGLFFIPSWGPVAAQQGTSFESNGIRLDAISGEITAQPHAAPRITSFVVVANLRIRNNAGQLVDFDQSPRIMVHVHEQITRAWITPAKLTARPDVVMGISHLELKLISNKPVEKIVWHSDLSFAQSIDQFLLNHNNPFNLNNYPQGQAFILPAPVVFDNRRQFPDNDVIKIPIHLEVKYANQADPVHMTIPTHLSHLLEMGQQINDGVGNNLFEIVRVEKKRQYRASVYAIFNDDTMGDITNNHGVTWDRGAGVNPDDIAFDNDGSFEVAKTAVGKTLAIKAQLPPSLAGPGLAQVQGQVIVGDSWLNANPIAEPLPGSPIHLAADQVPNVLFIAEGFDNRDGFKKENFQRIALSVYNKLRSETKTTPWNHLFANSINAWMLFERSAESAATILYESATFHNAVLENGQPADVALPLIDLLKQGNSRLNAEGGLTIEQLVLRVGLPLPADSNAQRNAKIAEWQQLFDPAIGAGNLHVSNDVFEFWKTRLVHRNLVEERDTLCGLRCGEKPKIEPALPSNIITFNKQSRIQRVNLDLFLSRIRARSAAGDVIGEKFWGRDQTGKFGKDYGLVVFLVGGLRSIGTRDGEKGFPEGQQVNTGINVGLVDDHIALNFLGQKFNVNYPFFLWRQSAGAPSFEIVPFPVPNDIPISAFATIAHEFSHSFGLDDEYARPGKLNVTPQTRVDDVYNLQLHAALLAQNQISGERVKWRWPRIRKAGVLESVSAAGNTVTVRLKAGHATQFLVGEEVRLRQRDILKTPLANLSSPELKVFSKNENDSTVVLQALSPFNPTAFGRDSLLFLPVKAPTEDKNNPTHDKYAEVLSPLLRHQINQSHKPQTPFPCNQEDTKSEQDPVNMPSNLKRPNNHRHVIGLFSGGKEFSCGIYHPSGECIMRNEYRAVLETIAEGTRFKSREIYQFCHVCRYSLVDQIDPLQHAKIDAAYAEIYPQLGLSTLKKVVLVVLGILVVVGVGYGIKELTD